jgi:hypothetical protein
MPATRAQRLVRPDTSFGPFRHVEAVAWLMLALACRIAGMNETPWWPLALCGDSIAVLMAFIAVARRVFEIFGHRSPVDGLTFDQELRLSLRIFGRMTALMLAATLLLGIFVDRSVGSIFLLGLDGIVFDAFSILGKIASAGCAALVLLFILGVDRASGKPGFASTLRAAIHYGARLGAAVAVLVIFYMALGLIQRLMLYKILGFGPVAAAGPHTQNLIYFMLTLGFAVMRLWATLLILTCGLKPSGTRT